MKLINNEIVDFIFAMNYFANRNKTSQDKYQGINELAIWSSKYEKQISPFLLNDIALLIETMVFPSKYLFLLYTKTSGMGTVEQFLTRLKQVSPHEFIDQFQQDFLAGNREALSIEELQNILSDEAHNPGYDPAEEANLLYAFLQEPAQFLERLHRIYSDFYTLVYKPAHSSLKEIENKKLQWHQKKLKEESADYFKELGLAGFMNSLNEKEEAILYFSLFADTNIYSFWNLGTAIIGAGTDTRIIDHTAYEKTDEFFSCFGDPKRLDILRLTAKRPWYSTELANYFGLKPATLSYHINILVNADLLHLHKGESRRFYYTLNTKTFREYLNFVEQDLLGNKIP